MEWRMIPPLLSTVLISIVSAIFHFFQIIQEKPKVMKYAYLFAAIEMEVHMYWYNGYFVTLIFTPTIILTVSYSFNAGV